MSFSLLVVQVKRMDSAPEVNGAKPCIVSFAAWKDKENVLRQAKLLKGCGIYITEDVSHKNGESPLSLSLGSPLPGNIGFCFCARLVMFAQVTVWPRQDHAGPARYSMVPVWAQS